MKTTAARNAMRILLINQYAGSPNHGMEYRPYCLARQWTDSGHDVNVLAASFSHLRTKNPEVTGIAFREEVSGIHYRWVRSPSYSGNGLLRAINMLSFPLLSTTYGWSLCREMKLDIVIVSSPNPFTILPGYFLARQTGAKLVFEVRDLWPLTLIELAGMSRWHPFISALQWVEDFAYRKANCVVSLLPKAEGYMTSRGMDKRKFVYIPNGCDLEEWDSAASEMPLEHANVFQRLRDEGRFIIVYAGNHGLANALDTLIDAATDLIDTSATFVLVGKGPEKERLSKRVAQQNLSNVVFLPPVLRSSLPSLLAAADACYIGLVYSPIFQYGISPNKLLDYMMAGKPIIHAIEAGNDLVAQSMCGISVSPDVPSKISEAVVTLMRMDSGDREAMGRRGRKYVENNHSYEVLSNRFLELVTTMS